ncbi:thioredoxin [Halovulum sp. GXIMD14793]
MLEFGQDTASPAGDIVKDGSEATFMQDVIETSKEVPVIVDFWAPWCGPCKSLGPAIEAAVTAAKGKVKLVKIDIDQNQGIAAQLRIQSVPTVYAFINGQPVDGFQGAQGPAQLKDFVEKLIAASPAGDGGLGEALDAADEMLAEGAIADAAQTYAAILGEEPENLRAVAGLARAHIAAGNPDQAQALMDSVPEDKRTDPAIAAVLAELELGSQAADIGEIATLTATVEANPDNHQARFDLATAQIAAKDMEGAIDTLLELFRRDHDWNEGAAKEQLFKVFDLLGPQDPLQQKGRRRLSSLIFA